MTEREPSDEELMRRLASGREDSLGLLHDRYAPLIFKVASQTLGGDSAEDIVQDVFLAIWRKAGTFDPARGSFRSWALRIAHRQVINEFRRRARRRRLESASQGRRLEVGWAGHDPVEVIRLDECRAIVRAAVEALPLAQGRAVSLAFLGDLTNREVADSMDLPLGTAKSRIRSALRALRNHLSSRVATGLLGVVLLAVALVRDRAIRSDLDRQGVALRLVTSSDVAPLRLTNTPGTPAETHGQYRGRAETHLAVMTFSHFPTAPAGREYRAWGQFRGSWHLLGTVHPDPRGSDLVLAEGAHLATLPSALKVTLEPASPQAVPTGPEVIAWPRP